MKDNLTFDRQSPLKCRPRGYHLIYTEYNSTLVAGTLLHWHHALSSAVPRVVMRGIPVSEKYRGVKVKWQYYNAVGFLNTAIYTLAVLMIYFPTEHYLFGFMHNFVAVVWHRSPFTKIGNMRTDILDLSSS